MENNENKIYVSTIGEGIRFRSVRETRFKNACIEVHFYYPLKREEVTVNAVLISMLRRSCAKYPQYSELRRALSMLYGAVLDTSVSNIGTCQMLTVGIDFVDDRFIPGDECVSGECAGLLSELIFRPTVGENGSLFREDDLEITLRNAEERIRSRINDKAEYASSRCSEIMCEGEPMSIEPGGYLEDLPGVTREALAQAWRKIISTANVEIIMVGGADHKPVEKIFAQEFGAVARECKGLPAPPVYKEPTEVKEVTERMELQQSKMIMGFRMPILEPDDRTMAARLMSLLFGGATTSLLFKNVREKLSLCYYCSSGYSRSSGLLYVRSGIEEENREQAIEEIKRQLDIIANNAFTDDEFNAAKLFSLSAFDNIADSVGSIESWYSMQFLDGCVRTPEQAAERMKAVTRSQVAECASSARLDTIYLLAPELSEETGEPEGGNENE